MTRIRPGSATNDVLSATYAPQADKGERFVTALDQRTDATVVVLGDSSGTPTYGTTWPQRLGNLWATDYPNPLIQYRMFAAGTYGTPTVLSAGTGATTVLADSFNRSAANLYGTTPDIGAGTWTASNTTAHYSLPNDGTATRIGAADVAARAPFTSPGYITTTFQVSVITANGGDVKLISSNNPSPSRTFQIRLNCAASNIPLNVWDGTTDAVVSTLTFAAAGITASSSSAQTVTAEIAHHEDGTVTFTAGSATYTHTLTQTQSDAFATSTQAGFYGSSAGHKILDITSVKAGSPGSTLDIYNGSQGSTNAVDTLANLAALLPVEPDAVVISHSHNHLTDTPAQFEAKLDDLVAGVRAMYADTPIVISGQNPQYPPTANPGPHNTRQRDLRRYARVRGFGYVPVFEAYMAQANPQAYIDADGVHPTDSGTDGLQLWADTAHGYFDALSLRPA